MATRKILLLSLLLTLCLTPLGMAEDADPYSPEELEEIVGPIALYPDVVISSMLPASTVPTDVVQAARWIEDQDGEITEPPKDSGWDASVEAMLQFPDVVTWMSENLEWMEMLGYAVAVQEKQVLQAIQDFRAKADDAGNLKSSDEMEVVKEDDVIYVQPASPEVVYVPTYNPVAVVQPGYQWPAWGVGFAAGALGAWAFHGIAYGHHGGYGSINVNNSANFNFNNNGNINRGNVGGGNRWNAGQTPNRRPSSSPGSARPTQRSPSSRPGGGARPGKGGVKPGGARPGQKPGGRPGSSPGGARPGKAPSKPGGARPGGQPGGSRPGAKPGGSRPSTKPSTKPSARPSSSRGSRSSMSGSSNNGRSTRNASSRGNSSRQSSSASRSRSSGSRSSGGSRGGGGGSRGGGGGGRRR